MNRRNRKEEEQKEAEQQCERKFFCPWFFRCSVALLYTNSERKGEIPHSACSIYFIFYTGIRIGRQGSIKSFFFALNTQNLMSNQCYPINFNQVISILVPVDRNFCIEPDKCFTSTANYLSLKEENIHQEQLMYIWLIIQYMRISMKQKKILENCMGELEYTHTWKLIYAHTYNLELKGICHLVKKLIRGTFLYAG